MDKGVLELTRDMVIVEQFGAAGSEIFDVVPEKYRVCFTHSVGNSDAKTAARIYTLIFASTLFALRLGLFKAASAIKRAETALIFDQLNLAKSYFDVGKAASTEPTLIDEIYVNACDAACFFHMYAIICKLEFTLGVNRKVNLVLG